MARSKMNSKNKIDDSAIMDEFPILERKINGHRLVYLDSAATTLKPKTVVDALSKWYLTEASNVHRGAHTLSSVATDAFEGARALVKDFLGAEDSSEIIFTRGTTESLNLVAQSYGRTFLNSGDEIVLSEMEHHSNIVPWQMLCKEKGCRIVWLRVTPKGELDLNHLDEIVNSKTKMFAITHVSNSLGTINPIAEIVSRLKGQGVVTVVDGAQSVAILPIDVVEMGCDFFAFSGHKLFGPTGIGALYGKKELLEKMPPWQGGGSMIEDVTFSSTTYTDIPYRFEAGTPHIAGVIAMGVALTFTKSLGVENILAHEMDLRVQCENQLKHIAGIRVIGEAQHKAGILSFVLEDTHPSDVGALLDQLGVAVRTGHHCTQPLMHKLNLTGTVRASFSIYNTQDDVLRFEEALKQVREILL